MVIGLSEQQLAQVRAILAQHVPDREVWLFGSRVNGTARPYSDVDLMILGGDTLSFQESGALREAFSVSDLPYMVDLVNWAEASEAFRARVAAEHVVLQTGKVCMAGTETEHRESAQ